MVELYNQLIQEINELRDISKQLTHLANVLEGIENSTNSQSPNIGIKVATIAYAKYGHVSNSGGKCLGAVEDILVASGINIPIEDRVTYAYQFPDAISNNNSFNKCYFKSDNLTLNLDTLPAGSIIVFNPIEGHIAGHIEIKIDPNIGPGYVSDYLQYSRKNYGGKKHPDFIFLPK